jgi:uncharacterized membrane protein YcjF (UPF0283 family)
VKRELTYTYEALAQRQQLRNEMQKIAVRMQAVAGTPAFDELMKEYEALDKRHDAIQATEED